MRRIGIKTPISIAHLTVLEASPPELIGLADAAGCEFVGLRLIPVTKEERAWALLEDKTLLRETKRRLVETAIRVLDVELVKITPDLVVAELGRAFSVAAELGAQRVLTQVHDADFARARTRFWHLCE